MPQHLVQEYFPLNYTLEEGKSGKLVLRGEFGRVDVPTQNKRLYSRKITEREIQRLNDDLKGRRVYGELDHPSDGKTKFQRVSHIITNLEVQEDGRVVGEAEILNTPNGKIVKAIAEAAGGLGVSSRGFGSVNQRQDGVHEVGEDFRLKTYDIVVDPAMKSAMPDVFAESLMESEDFNWVEELRDEFPDLVESIRAEEAEKAKEAAEKAVADAIEQNTTAATESQKEAFERRLKEVVAGLREEVKEDLREEFESDPKRGASTAVLEQIASLVSAYQPDTDEQAIRDAMKAKDVQVAKAQEESSQWRTMARKAGYKLRVEQLTRKHPMQETIIAAMGDCSQFGSIKEIEEAVGKIQEDLKEIIPPKEEMDAAKVSEEISVRDATIKSLQEQLEAAIDKQGELSGRLHRAILLGEELQSRVEKLTTDAEVTEESSTETKIAEAKLRLTSGYTNQAKLLKLMENAEDEGEIAKIVHEHGERQLTDSRLQALRDKVARGAVHDGSETLTEDGKVAPVNRGAATSFVDQTANEILEMAGVIEGSGY